MGLYQCIFSSFLKIYVLLGILFQNKSVSFTLKIWSRANSPSLIISVMKSSYSSASSRAALNILRLTLILSDAVLHPILMEPTSTGIELDLPRSSSIFMASWGDITLFWIWSRLGGKIFVLHLRYGTINFLCYDGNLEVHCSKGLLPYAVIILYGSGDD